MMEWYDLSPMSRPAHSTTGLGLGQLEAAHMARHVPVDAELEADSLAQLSDHLAKAGRAERCNALANEHKRRFRALAL
jgi:hypothetical protein